MTYIHTYIHTYIKFTTIPSVGGFQNNEQFRIMGDKSGWNDTGTGYMYFKKSFSFQVHRDEYKRGRCQVNHKASAFSTIMSNIGVKL